MSCNVLFAHQSAEMYGSDKVLLYLLEGLSKSGITPIVLLPERGPLLGALESLGLEVHVVPLVKISRSTLSARGLCRLPFELWRSLRAVSRAVAGRKIDVVYSNTVAVLAAAVWARLRRVPHIWHVHEILLKPAPVRRGFPLLMRLLADRVICNSGMSREWVVQEQPRLDAQTVVIWNGQGERPPVNASAVSALAARLGIPEHSRVCALVGRINKWKGQGVFIEAANLLWQRGVRDVYFLIVGGAFANEEGARCLADMQARMAASPACDQLKWLDFSNDVWSVWDLCSLAVVPSTEPEPFGMVAIEAMASGRAVVAAAHGGLLEIVEDQQTGLLVEPGSAIALADAIQKLISAPDLRSRMGEAGRERQRSVFSLDRQVADTLLTIRQLSLSRSSDA